MAYINIGILAHVDAGKTTLTEHLLLYGGGLSAAGSVDKGTAQTDFLDIEKQRGISVRTASAVIEYMGVTVNIIDTPGHADFAAEVERSLRVLDCAVLMFSAVEGVQAQTEALWNAVSALGLPAVMVINKTDRLGADPERVLRDIHNRLTDRAVFIPDELFDKSPSGGMDAVLDMLTRQDDALLEMFLSGDIVKSALLESLKKQTAGAQVYPVFKTSAISGEGVEHLLRAITELCPRSEGSASGALSGVVYKVDHDTRGRAAHVRLFSGTMHNRDMVHSATLDIDEKVTQIRKTRATKQYDAGVLEAGDIGTVYGLSARVGDILGDPGGVPPGYRLASPLLTVMVKPRTEQEYPALLKALKMLEAEDPLLSLSWSSENRELNIQLMGKLQLEVLSSVIKTRFGIDAVFGKASTLYLETPSREAEGFVAYTMPKPCWAVIRFNIKPGALGSGVKYINAIRDNDKLLPRYQEHIEKALQNALKQGILGWPITDAVITLIDGEHHNIHTHALDFYVATPMALLDGLRNCGSTLLEPLYGFRITAPEVFSGKIIGELSTMRCEYETRIIDGTFYSEGKTPVSESLDFPARLGSLSSGKALLQTRAAGYQPCPPGLGVIRPYNGVSPLDTAKYILSVRNAIE